LTGPGPVAALPSADARARRAFFVVGAASALAVTAVLLIVSLVRNDGHLLYVIDDAGIHLSLAHQLATHATWGPYAGHYASASSSPGWTMLLAGLSLGHTGLLQILPVALNVAAGLWIIWLFARHQDYLLPAGRRWAGYLLVAVLPVVLWFLPGLAMVGMEHALHAALVVQALVLLAGLQTGRLTLRRCWPFLAIVSLASLVRYESAFLAAGCAAGLVLATTSRFGSEATRTRGRLRASLGLAALTVAAAALPIAIFGFVNRAFGEGFLPNSVTAKALVGKGTAPLVPSIDATMRALQQDGMVLVPTLAAAAYLIWAWFGGPRANVAIATAFLVTAVLHASYANFHYFERYQAYLVIAGSFVLLRLASEVVPRARKPAALAFALVVVVALSTARVIATYDAPLGTSNTYRQRYQLARFFAAYYQGRAIGTGELGYPSLLHHGPIVDPLGLGTHPFLVEMQRYREPRAAFVDAYFRRYDVQAIAIYPGNALGFELPKSWILVGEWRLDERNVSGFEKVLAFYARDERMARELDRNLRAFAHRLPSHVSTVDRADIVDRFLRGLRP
jgi:hypothetical protein